MIYKTLEPHHLPAMLRIVEACRTQMNLNFEFRWDLQSLEAAFSVGEGLGVFHPAEERLMGFAIFLRLAQEASAAPPAKGQEGSHQEGSHQGRPDQVGAGQERRNLKARGVLEILCLATDPADQKKGLMGGLIKHLSQHFGGDHLSGQFGGDGALGGDGAEIWLEVHEGNSVAIQFYKNKGFQVVGRRKNYYKDGASALLMTLS